jgi:hypothetical protein
MISQFLDECRPRMQELVKNAKHVPSLLPSWTPGPSADKKLAKHISGLGIPTVLGRQPSLLLHDLEEEKSDLTEIVLHRCFFLCIPHMHNLSFNARLAHQWPRHSGVLINTSGSGKTWLLLEGLCRRWGFYFVAKPDRAGKGSGDLWQIMGELDDARDCKRAKTSKEADSKAKATIEHIREAAEYRLAQLLLARFLLLNLLVQEARKTLGGLQEKEHRRLWVLLQAQPNRIFGANFKVDIFTALARLLQHASTNDLKDRITSFCTLRCLSLSKCALCFRERASSLEFLIRAWGWLCGR